MVKNVKGITRPIHGQEALKGSIELSNNPALGNNQPALLIHFF